jgi:uncharacterized LabA/DUF88 family protein
MVYEEKETDVNIAIAMLTDVVCDMYDTALLVSADSDLRSAAAAVKHLRAATRTAARDCHKGRREAHSPGVLELTRS